MSDGAKKVEYRIVVDEQHLAALDEVVGRLREAGMDVAHVLPTTGAVIGVADPETADSLRAVKGVAAIDRTQEIEAHDRGGDTYEGCLLASSREYP